MTLRHLVPLGLVLMVAACGGGEAPQTVFAPLSYDYLRPIRLNVATLDVEDHAVAQGDDVAAQAPVPPAQALTQMAHDRIFPGGASGRAVFVIQDASIHRRGDTLAGSLAVRLDIVGPGGQPAAFAEARVARSSTTDDGDLHTREYALTKQMMDDMNVELEFQARRALKAWLQPEGDVPGAVSVQPLGGPGGGSGSAPGGALPATAPGYGAAAGASGPVPDAAGGRGRAMSPPPGSLALPPGPAGAAGAALPAASPYSSEDAPPAVPPSSFGAPPAAASPYDPPSYGQPASGQPSYGQPSYGQAPYGQPSYGQAPYAAPPTSALPYSPPPGLQSGPLPLTE